MLLQISDWTGLTSLKWGFLTKTSLCLQGPTIFLKIICLDQKCIRK